MAKRAPLKPSDFVHLHNHTHYSLLDGLTKVPRLIERVKTLGMEAVAITDHGSMSGAVELYKTAIDAGIKPIIGMEAYVAPRTHLDKDPSHDRQVFHLTMLAQTNEGYRNLMKLATTASLDGFYYRPRVDHELIKKHRQGIIVLSGCMGGEVSDALAQRSYESAKQTAAWYKDVFGDRYYIELADHGHPEHPTCWDQQRRVNAQLVKIADELNIPTVVTCDAHYLNQDDQQAHEVLLCVQTGAFLADESRMSLADFDLHVTDPKDVIKRWEKEFPQALINSKKIAERCDVKIEMGKILIPKFPTPKGETEKSLLEKLVWQGLAWRYGGIGRDKAAKLDIAKAQRYLDSQVVDRAEYELSVINKVGFNGFFLIVIDFVNWGKDQGIVFGPGRGSTAGSIVAFATRMTDLDPLKYDLLFERFLTADRVSPPDMDIDIQDNRRDEVIKYCIEKYGRDRVANIVTFGTMAARNSVRDVARVLQVPYAEADRLAKMIPPPVQGRHTPLAKHLEEVSELVNENRTNGRSAEIFELAQKLEGTIRSHGVHAAGVIITPDDLVKLVPLEMAQKGVVATQYSMGPIEDLGLLKIDFLGLSNLTIIKNALRIIKKVYSKDIDIDRVPLDDGRTFELLQNGETTGIFQLESAGMKHYLKQLKPTAFEDIIAMVALYRPGPLTTGLIDRYIARKNKTEAVSYDHPLMKNALNATHGVIVYQEQVMQIVKDMCGFTGSEADTLRKAVGKKQRETMAKMHDKIIKGAVANQVSRRVADKFWKDLQGFADYAFNKSHAACYGLIAYQTAYLKANYPDAFMASLMTSDYDNTDRLAIEIAECKNMGLKVLPPDISESFHEFAIVLDKKQIRFGLDAVKNVGHGAAEEIIRAREAAGGKLASIEDFCANVSPQIVNRKALESLIKAGALDSYADRDELVGNIENILALSGRLQKESSSGQVDLFGSSDEVSEELQPRLAWDRDVVRHSPFEKMAWERELLGLYLSRHPLEDYGKALDEQTVPIVELSNQIEGASVVVGGSVSEVREIVTRNGAKMAFVRITDQTGEIELVVFPKKYGDGSKVVWKRDQVLLVRGSLGSGRNAGSAGELKVLVDEVRHLNGEHKGEPELSGVNKESTKVKTAENPIVPKRLYIKLADSSDQPLLLTLKRKLDNHRGDTEVVLVTGEDNHKQAIKLPQTIEINETSLRDLAKVFGATNVVLK
ncbi:DNA polymerase III subunit alpha [Candidatus Saccharibacteria bacterium RIFCSPHIGHO2_12_FULL_49_19]|nr:MAG: DNA polymerase III subunit alpha [Candidatus Saccharibacteria bacterium RIFCSPHIGHO2_12_FULL_49_19]OGL38114.1 MAG: DNA polymerase III subunit alpha [Candidatus Saccharibacteria bacterium RIFCSPLOWO2_01_FULL_49_22]